MIVLKHGTLVLQARDIGYPKRTLDLKINLKRSMNGDIKTTIQTPVTTTHEQPIGFLSKTDLDLFTAFIEAKMGQTIQYTDRDAVTWNVKITSEPNEIVDQARSNRTCNLRMVSLNG